MLIRLENGDSHHGQGWELVAPGGWLLLHLQICSCRIGADREPVSREASKPAETEPCNCTLIQFPNIKICIKFRETFS